MVRYLIFLVFITFLSCQKEVILFDSEPDEDYQLPLLLRINGKDCVFDVDRGLLKYSIAQQELSEYTPLIEFQEHSQVKFESIELSNGSNNYLGELKLNTPYKLTFNTEESINDLTLVFTNIPIVQLVTLDPIANEPKTLAHLTLNYPSKAQQSEKSWIGVEHRGASTFKYEKKSLGLKPFAAKNTLSPVLRSFFGLEANNSWVLDAMYVDQSRLRNKFSFDLWRLMPGPVDHIGIESRFVEVFINNEAQGLYMLTENYSASLLDLNSESVLYQGLDNSKTAKFLKFPKHEPKRLEWAGWEQKFPDPSVEIKWNDFEALSDLIVRSSDGDFQNKIADVIDLDNVIDYILFTNLFKGTDNVGKNWHWLKRNPSDRFHIIPWDMDRTWGRSGLLKTHDFSGIITNGLFTRLDELNPRNYTERRNNRWTELRSSVFSEENLQLLLFQIFMELQNYDIAGFENELWGAELDLVAEQAYMDDWIKNRLVYLDENLGK